MATIYKFRRTWYISFKEGGRRVQRSLGTTNKATATEKLHEIQTKEDRGELNLRIKADSIPLQQFIDEYLASCQVNHSKKTFELEKAILKVHFARFCEDKKISLLSDVSLHLLENYKIWRSQKAQAACINRELTVFKAMISRAVALGKLPSNPLKGLDGKTLLRDLPGVQKRVRFLTFAEIKRLMETANERWKAIICVAVNTGMRKGEIQHLRWEDVNLARNQISVANHAEFHTKSRKVRHIPMTAACRAALEGLPREGTYVFGGNSGQDPFLSQFSRSFSRIVRRAGIPEATFHTLRHTFASHLVMKGVPLSTVQEFLGHADFKTTQIYSHLAEDHKQEAIERLEFAEATA